MTHLINGLHENPYVASERRWPYVTGIKSVDRAGLLWCFDIGDGQFPLPIRSHW